MKVSDYDTLYLLNRLPEDTALTSSEAAVFLRMSLRSLERMRSPQSPTKGPRYQQPSGLGSKGANQRITYLIKDLKAWQASITVSDNVEAAVRKGQLFRTLADLTDQVPFWRNPKGVIAGLVEETSEEMFFARIGKWEIEWIEPGEAAAEHWESSLSHKQFAAAVTKILSTQMNKIAAAVEGTEIGEFDSPPKLSGGRGPLRPL